VPSFSSLKRYWYRCRGTEGLTLDVRIVAGDQFDAGQPIQQAITWLSSGSAAVRTSLL
jgi:hypothetical protein